MTRIVVLSGFLTGLLFIVIHLLGSVFYYVGGYLVPVVICSSLWITFKRIYNKQHEFKLGLFFTSAISVLVISLFIIAIFLYFFNEGKGDIRAYFALMLLGLFLGFIMVWLFKLSVKNKVPI